MASKKPVIHGRDHLPGGADPIPRRATDGQTSWAHFRNFTGDDLASTGTCHFNTTDATLFNTSDAAMFEFFPHASLGAGIKLLAPGVFKVTWGATIDEAIASPETLGVEINPLALSGSFLLSVDEADIDTYGKIWPPGGADAKWRLAATRLIGYETVTSSNILKIDLVNQSSQAFTDSVYGSIYVEYLSDENQPFADNWY